MFELLLSPTVKYVDIQSVRPFFRQPFAAMLRQLGNGLQDFVLEDSSWLQGRDVLSSALATMSGLQRISLRYLANDLMVFHKRKQSLYYFASDFIWCYKDCSTG